MVGAPLPGVPSSFDVSTLPGLAVPVTFTVTVALPVTVPLPAVTVNCPAPGGLNEPDDAVPRGEVIQPAHEVTSIVWPSENLPDAFSVTAGGFCPYVKETVVVGGETVMLCSPVGQLSPKLTGPPLLAPPLSRSRFRSGPPSVPGLLWPWLAHPAEWLAARSREPARRAVGARRKAERWLTFDRCTRRRSTARLFPGGAVHSARGGKHRFAMGKAEPT